MRRVTGIGGIFIKAKDPAALGAWYKQHRGIEVQGDLFAPSRPPFMIDYRVADLKSLLAALRSEGCKVLDDSEYGRFGRVIDPEGNKVELWQPPEGQ
jgi:predicted enzyme related to lactoylglutathione lyase